MEYPTSTSWSIPPQTGAALVTCWEEARRGPPIVEVTGAVTGRYELLEQAEDGTIVLGADISA